jgi:F-type H+-transporting ATPase subunit b
MNQKIFIILAQENEKGGLFDIGATLPLVAIQFLILMFILNSILYNPLQNIINNRNEYILDNLSKASEMLNEATELTKKYSEELALTKKQTQIEINNIEKIQKITFTNEIEVCQKSIDKLIQKFLNNFIEKKIIILKNITPEIDLLSEQMIKTLFQN